MNLEESRKNVISKELIFLNSQLKTQDKVIQFMVQQAKIADYVTDVETVEMVVAHRESEIPTAIGYQIAMPHGKTEAISHPFIAFLRTEEEFQWSKKDDERVCLIFLIGIPEKSTGKLHLKFISQLSKKLLDEEFRHSLLRETNRDRIFEQLNAIDI